MKDYSDKFFENMDQGSISSAKEVVPIILDLIQPKSIIDAGCGTGAWLSIFREFGVMDILGLDGDYVKAEFLHIPEDKFKATNLTEPFRIDREFDLVISLEVAEHLPKNSAESFVKSLTNLASVVIFSAAIPFQKGENHINLQWPNYWENHFYNKGFIAIDCLRSKIWGNTYVEWWYAQNIIVYVKEHELHNYPKLQLEYQNDSSPVLSLVHPNNYLELHKWEYQTQLVKNELQRFIPEKELFIFIDDGKLSNDVTSGCNKMSFLEKNGQYQGAPASDGIAIEELKRLRMLGIRFLVITWPSFWWFDYYQEFTGYLKSNSICILNKDYMLMFDISNELSTFDSQP